MVCVTLFKSAVHLFALSLSLSSQLGLSTRCARPNLMRACSSSCCSCSSRLSSSLDSVWVDALVVSVGVGLGFRVAEKNFLLVLRILGIKLLADQTVLAFSFYVNKPPHLQFRAISQILVEDKVVVKHLFLFNCLNASSFFL